MTADLPPLPVPVACVRSAAVEYRLPPLALFGILAAEGGRPSLVHKNRDGSEDYGPMQINSRWLPLLSRDGESRTRLIDDPCENVRAGAWILAQVLSRDGNIWTAIGHYHSPSPRESRRYRHRVGRMILSWIGRAHGR